MGIISVIAVLAGFYCVYHFQKNARKLSRDSVDEVDASMLRWGSRAGVLVIVLGLVGVVDTYVYKLPNPFDGPKTELAQPKPKAAPEKPTEARETVKPDPMGDAKAEHKAALEDFKQSSAQ